MTEIVELIELVVEFVVVELVFKRAVEVETEATEALVLTGGLLTREEEDVEDVVEAEEKAPEPEVLSLISDELIV